MPKSTPNPTNSTANAIESRFSEPTIISPTAVVMERPIKRLTNTGEDDLRRMQRHPENQQHHEHGADPVDDGAVLNGGEFLVGDRNRSGQPDPRAIFAWEIEIAGGLPDGIGRILARLQRVEVEDRLELDEGAPIGIGQRLVAGEFAPGECPGAVLHHVLYGLGDQREWPLGAVEFDLSALDAGEPGFQRAGQSPYAGIAGHDFDQRCGGLELAGQPADFRHRKEQQSVFFEKFPGTESLDRFEMLGVAGQFLFERCARCTGELRRRSVHHGKNRSFPIECLLELIVALAPIQIRRNQRVDVGVDCEMTGCIEARRYRKAKCDQDSEKGKPRASFDNRYDNTCQHSLSF